MTQLSLSMGSFMAAEGVDVLYGDPLSAYARNGYGWTREWTRGKINAQPTDGRVAAWKFYVAFKRILLSMLAEFLLERI